MRHVEGGFAVDTKLAGEAVRKVSLRDGTMLAVLYGLPVFGDAVNCEAVKRSEKTCAADDANMDVVDCRRAAFGGGRSQCRATHPE